MTRSSRMQPVQRVVDEQERARAAQLASAQARVAAAEAKLQELQRYHGDYSRGFNDRAAGGTNGAALRDYQVFLARLAEALRQQQVVVERARQDLDTVRRMWEQAAVRAKAVGTVVEGWKREERRAQDRIEQQDSDERALRARRTIPGHRQ